MNTNLSEKSRFFFFLAAGLALVMIVGAAVYWLKPGAELASPAGAAAVSVNEDPVEGSPAIRLQKSELAAPGEGLLEGGGEEFSELTKAASEQAGKIINQLLHMDLGTKISAEQAQTIHQELSLLAVQGRAAVPAIRDFLEQNMDLDFQPESGANLVGYWSLRAAMFDVLRQIGGIEAQTLLADTLRTTADPAEIAWLAQHLDQQVPGVFRQEAVHAARETLAMAAQGQVPVRDAGPLFRVLQAYGDASVAADLAGSMPHWEYYGAMALAGLRDGQGIPALVEQAQVGGGSRGFAVEMLAQVAPLHPQAAEALIEQASTSQLPDWAWRRIAIGLTKDQYRFDSPTFDGPVAARRVPGMASYHYNNGTENFWSLPLSPDDPSISQRIAIIDQLLSVTSDPAASKTLEQARARLGR
jgi:hypothetical protein